MAKRLSDLLEYQMAAIDGEVEVEVRGINWADAEVILIIGVTIVAHHHALHVSCAVAIVGYRNGYHSFVHSSKPCAPIELAAAWNTSCIAVAPTIVVGTYNSILSGIQTSENYTEVVPVRNTIGEVLEALCIGLASRYIDILGVSAPEWR